MRQKGDAHNSKTNLITIFVHRQDKKPFIYRVKKYETLPGGLIRFHDEKEGVNKTFDARNCEIHEPKRDGV